MECPDCGVAPGELHTHGCDVERCPRCGVQAIGCGCIYEVCGIDRETMEEKHPEIYKGGPTKEMYEKFDAKWASKRQPWSGMHPGEAACAEFGWYARMPHAESGDYRLERCNKDDPGAVLDLNRLHMSARWDAENGRWVRG